MTFRSLSFFIVFMPVEHYENFPVASFLLPARLRPAVETIYRFARTADDIADEGDASPEQRLQELAAFEAELDGIEKNSSSESLLFKALALVIREHQLPIQSLRDLLSAFKQDVITTRYTDFAALLDYCKRSANPVGRLMLHLYKKADAANLHDADAICSALQLINFWQDVAIDWQKQRIYLPLADMQRFGVSEQQIANHIADDAWRALMQFQVGRARELMLSGAPLAKRLPGRLGWELRLVVQGGLYILDKIEQANCDVFRHRPKIGKTDWIKLTWRALRM